MRMKSLITEGGHVSPDAMVIPLLRALVKIGGDAPMTTAYEKMRDFVYLTDKDLVVNKHGEPYYYRHLSHIVARMRGAGLLREPTGDNWLHIMDAGRILAGKKDES